ncbi:UNVERIFIED_CONTAM: putative ribonuclease H protein [Sesamum latifolium]|uniref:Ribonuclease H protein n=1 Tax=Sesamum latifolium TaxID=2727402 RepID=A0AAW2VEE3_9LAMI
MRNQVKHNGENFTARKIVRNVLNYLWHAYKGKALRREHWKGDLTVATNLGLFFMQKQTPPPKLVRWVPPVLGWIKLNSDGASKGNPGIAGGGGILRDNNGRGIFAFQLFFGTTTSTFAELAALVRGLSLNGKEAFTESGWRLILRLAYTS